MYPKPRPSWALGTLPGLRWLVDGRWAPAMPLFVSLVIPFLLAVGLEWRVPSLLHQYKGAFPGDLFLSIAGAYAICTAILCLRRYNRWYSRRAWHVFALGFGLVYAAIFAYGEVMNTIHQWVPSAAYTWPQIFSPTHLYHLLVTIPVFGYLFWTVVVPVWIHAPWRPWPIVARVIIVLMIVAWAYCAFYVDNHVARPDLSEIHGEWFRGLWRGLIPQPDPMFS